MEVGHIATFCWKANRSEGLLIVIFSGNLLQKNHNGNKNLHADFTSAVFSTVTNSINVNIKRNEDSKWIVAYTCNENQSLN